MLTSSSVEDRVRLSLYEHLVRSAGFPTLEELAAQTSSSPDDVRAALTRLAEAKVIVLAPASDQIHWAPPFSQALSPFRVVAGERRWWAPCAWEALAIPALVEGSATIRTRCDDCGDTLELTVEGPRLSEPSLVVHVLLPARQWWRDVLHTCGTLRMFLSEAHVERWCATNEVERGAVVPVAQMSELAKAWFTDRRDPAWKRPTPDGARAIFSAVGLTGPFWQL